MKYLLTKTTIITFIGLGILVLWVLSSTQRIPSVQGSSPQGMRTVVASSTVKVSIGPDVIAPIFALNSSCASRVITTYASPLMFTVATSTDLDQNVRPTGQFGHLQPASSTVVYDSGTYGCDVWQAYGFSSTTISVSEYQGFK